MADELRAAARAIPDALGIARESLSRSNLDDSWPLGLGVATNRVASASP